MGAALAALLIAAAFSACSPAQKPAAADMPTAAQLTPSPTHAPVETLEQTPVLINVTLYLPDESGGLVATPAQAADSPRGLIAALVSAGALPDVNYGRNITFSVGQEDLIYADGTLSGVFVHLDLSDAFAQSIKASDAADQRIMLQSLVNTFLTRYGAEGLLLSIEGTDLQTMDRRYDRPLLFDQLAQTHESGANKS
jgi:hypothetical protein